MKGIDIVLLAAFMAAVMLTTARPAESSTNSIKQFVTADFDDSGERLGTEISRSLLHYGDDTSDDDDDLEDDHRRFKSPPSPRFTTCATNRSICLQPGSKGHKCCDKECTDVRFDEYNCGICGIRCLYGFTCCNRFCVNLQKSRFNCGKCGNRCPPIGRGRSIGLVRSVPADCNYGFCDYNGGD